MKEVFKYLREKKLTISFAESITGGRLSSEITKNNGSSEVFKGSVVAYSKELKVKLLNVSLETINKYTMVSEEVNIEMIEGLKTLVNTDIYISVTGSAGPDLEESTNEFMAYVTISYNNEYYTGMVIFDTNDRLANINDTVQLVNDMILNYVD